jgi:hypothetical protein
MRWGGIHRPRWARWASGVGLLLFFVTVGAAPAGAATSIGEAFTPSVGCGASTFIQSASPDGSYAAPTSGVITSWSYQASATPPAQLRLKLGRVAGATAFLIAGQSDLQAPVANTLNTYSTRIPAQAGDLIGLYQSTKNADCGVYTPGYFARFVADSDVPPGPDPIDFQSSSGFKLAIGAILEPDADNDGFGDETQDACPTNAAAQGACPLVVKKKKCKRHKKKHRAAEVAKKKHCKRKRK